MAIAEARFTLNLDAAFRAWLATGPETNLFLAGIGSHFAYRAIRYGLAGVAGALLVVAIVFLATAPKPA